MKLDNNQQAFLALLRAGLWEQDIQLSPYEPIDFSKVYLLAEEQTVVGLIAAGLEHVIDIKIPQDVALSFAGDALQQEQQNMAMNAFVSEQTERMRNLNIDAILVKGQGIAQCYERPLWRTSGDVDFFLTHDNYNRAKSYFDSICLRSEKEVLREKHLSYNIGEWVVELHGTLRTTLLKKLDNVIDEVQKDVFCNEGVRSWMNGNSQVFLPSPDNDVIIVFSHFLKHFFNGGIGLRQLCDCCRLIWTFRETIDKDLLMHRLSASRTESEWRAFAALAVNYLGMPEEVMPLYSLKKRWERKGKRILSFIIKTGNFGYNRDKSFLISPSFIERNLKRFWYITKDTSVRFFIFPLDSLRVWDNLMRQGLRGIIRNRGKDDTESI